MQEQTGAASKDSMHRGYSEEGLHRMALPQQVVQYSADWVSNDGECPHEYAHKPG